ncbi:hypothetical protein GSB9_03360 [Flavobacteriaceae bacterium GSB9]|nr:hypothetical protein GSB9_03360 [Flavobacteriaceae bacterium GSB9]
MNERIKYHLERFKKGGGKQLLAFSSIFLLNPSSTIFAIPFYTLGLILIWNTQMTKKVKWRWTILPIIIAGILTIIIQIVYEINPKIFPF